VLLKEDGRKKQGQKKEGWEAPGRKEGKQTKNPAIFPRNRIKNLKKTGKKEGG